MSFGSCPSQALVFNRYTLVDSRRPMGFVPACAALEQLAVFHAVSFAYRKAKGAQKWLEDHLERDYVCSNQTPLYKENVKKIYGNQDINVFCFFRKD